jgi:hypothetical protein
MQITPERDESLALQLDEGKRFSDLIDYFELESARFDILFTSAFVEVNNERLGIPELARKILPRPSLFPFLSTPARENTKVAS